jgi:hypothetical protein
MTTLLRQQILQFLTLSLDRRGSVVKNRLFQQVLATCGARIASYLPARRPLPASVTFVETALMNKALLAAPTLFLLATATAHGTLLFENMPPDSNQAGVLGIGVTGAVMEIANDFEIGDVNGDGKSDFVSLSSVSLWTNGVPPVQQVFDYSVWRDASGAPGPLVASGTATSIVRTDLGGTFPNEFQRWDANLANPVALVPDVRYWFGVQFAGPPASDFFGWRYSSSTFGNLPVGRLSGSGPFSNTLQFDTAFQLNGTVVPAVPSVLLILTGLAGLMGSRAARARTTQVGDPQT